MKILGIESSCDETAAAVVEDDVSLGRRNNREIGVSKEPILDAGRAISRDVGSVWLAESGANLLRRHAGVNRLPLTDEVARCTVPRRCAARKCDDSDEA